MPSVYGSVEQLWTWDPDYVGFKLRVTTTGRVHTFLLSGQHIQTRGDVSPLQDATKTSLLRDAFINGYRVGIEYSEATNYAVAIQIMKT